MEFDPPKISYQSLGSLLVHMKFKIFPWFDFNNLEAFIEVNDIFAVNCPSKSTHSDSVNSQLHLSFSTAERNASGMTSNNENKIRKTLLTPCRRQGLKRKSLESTPNTSNDLSDSRSPCVINTILNRSLTHSDTIITTPVRHVTEKSNTRLEKKQKVQQEQADEVPTSESSKIDTFLHHEENQGDDDDLDSQIEKINKRISEKRLEIKKLELDSKNVKQHNFNDLNLLICKWRQGCQAALKDLLQEYQNRDNNLTLPILLNQLGIPQTLVHYSETEMDFKY